MSILRQAVFTQESIPKFSNSEILILLDKKRYDFLSLMNFLNSIAFWRFSCPGFVETKIPILSELRNLT